MSFCTTSSVNFRPMSRLTAASVFCGFVTAWRLADCPTSTSPSFVKATIDGVVRSPSLFSMTLGLPPSMIETHEFVVPRSMPIIFAICKPSRKSYATSRSMGYYASFSISRPLIPAVARSLADDDPGGAQQAPVQGIALLNNRQDGIRRQLGALLGHHGLVPFGIKRLRDRVDDFDAGLVKGTVQLAQGRLRALEQCRARIGGARIDTRFERIADRHEFLGKALDRKFTGIIDVTLGALAVIFEFRDRPQIAVPIFLRLCFGGRQRSVSRVRARL